MTNKDLRSILDEEDMRKDILQVSSIACCVEFILDSEIVSNSKTSYDFTLKNVSGNGYWKKRIYRAETKTKGYVHKNGVFILDDEDLKNVEGLVLPTLMQNGFAQNKCLFFRTNDPKERSREILPLLDQPNSVKPYVILENFFIQDFYNNVISFKR